MVFLGGIIYSGLFHEGTLKGDIVTAFSGQVLNPGDRVQPIVCKGLGGNSWVRPAVYIAGSTASGKALVSDELGGSIKTDQAGAPVEYNPDALLKLVN